MKPRKSTPFCPNHSIAAAAMALVLTHFAAPAAFATTYYWDNDGDTAGFGSATGSWTAPTTGDATQGWSTSSAGTVVPGDVTTTTSDTVNFGTATAGLATGTINVSGTVNVNKVNYGSASGAITLSGGTIALGGTAPAITASKAGQIIGSALTLNANTSVIAGIKGDSVLGLNGVIDGSGGLTFTTASINFSGAATSVSLGASSSYTGTTTITLPNTTAAHNNSLTVKASTDNALPTATVLTLDGYVGVGSGRTVAYDLAGNDQTLAGLTNVARNLRFQRILNSGGAATLTIDNTSNYTFSGNINGTNLGLKKTGAGTQTLGAANAYTGSTTIDGGTLALGAGGSINSTSGVALGGGTFDVSAKAGGYAVANLTGSGTVVGALTVSATLGIGNSPGTINFDSLTLAATSTYTYDLTGGGAAADLGNVSGSLMIDTGAGLDLVQLGTYTLGDKFTLFAYQTGNLTGAFAALGQGAMFNDAGGLWQIDYAADSAGLNGGTGTSFVTITAVPEPSAVAGALLGGLGLLAWSGRRRRTGPRDAFQPSACNPQL